MMLQTSVTSSQHTGISFPHLLQTLGVKFSRRPTNVATHVLAGEATLSALIVYFDVLDCINSIVINKML